MDLEAEAGKQGTNEVMWAVFTAFIKWFTYCVFCLLIPENLAFTRDRQLYWIAEGQGTVKEESGNVREIILDSGISDHYHTYNLSN